MAISEYWIAEHDIKYYWRKFRNDYVGDHWLREMVDADFRQRNVKSRRSFSGTLQIGAFTKEFFDLESDPEALRSARGFWITPCAGQGNEVLMYWNEEGRWYQHKKGTGRTNVGIDYCFYPDEIFRINMFIHKHNSKLAD